MVCDVRPHQRHIHHCFRFDVDHHNDRQIHSPTGDVIGKGKPFEYVTKADNSRLRHRPHHVVVQFVVVVEQVHLRDEKSVLSRRMASSSWFRYLLHVVIRLHLARVRFDLQHVAQQRVQGRPCDDEEVGGVHACRRQCEVFRDEGSESTAVGGRHIPVVVDAVRRGEHLLELHSNFSDRRYNFRVHSRLQYVVAAGVVHGVAARRDSS